MGRVTIRDVAERAGVSTSTVSRTLHNNPRISDETKDRVLSAVRELHYRPFSLPSDEPAQSVALMLPSSSSDLLRHAFFVHVMRGISLHAQSQGLLTTYFFAANVDEQLDLLRRCVESSAIRGVILLAVYQHDPCVDLLADSGTPFVVIGRPDASSRALWVDNDNFHAMYDVVNRLMEQGHRKLGFVGGPPEMNVTRDRLEGYRMALANRGLEADKLLVQHCAGFSRDGGYEAARTMFASARPEAIVATDDYLALGALDYMRDAGPRVPIIGFNNSVEGREADPGLSSVDINPEELGRQASRLLSGAIAGEELADDHVIVPTSLVQRQSSALVLA